MIHRPDTPPLPVSDDRAAELLAAEREDRRWRWREMLLVLSFMVLSVAAGLLLMAWSVHTTDLRYAGIAFWTGLVIGNGGVLLTMIVAAERAVRGGRH